MDNVNVPRKPDYDEPQLPIKEATPGHIALAATKGVKTIALQIGYKRLQVSYQICTYIPTLCLFSQIYRCTFKSFFPKICILITLKIIMLCGVFKADVFFFFLNPQHVFHYVLGLQVCDSLFAGFNYRIISIIFICIYCFSKKSYLFLFNGNNNHSFYFLMKTFSSLMSK